MTLTSTPRLLPPCTGPSASRSSHPRAKARYQSRVPDAGGGWRPPLLSRSWPPPPGWALRETRRGTAEGTLAAAALDAHLRSLQLGHLTDVASTDAHTVKPWFEGKLSYSPPVVDLATEGFPLIGGRLDVVEGRTIAALVYARRKHVLSVFVWPADDAPETTPRSGARQGYGWIQWSHAGMRYWVVSDVAPAELEELARLLRR